MKNSFRRTFVQGLLVFLPVFLTFYILYLVLEFIYRMMDFGVLLLPESYRSDRLLAGPIVLITILLTLIFIAFIGLTAKTLFGRAFQRYLNWALNSIPVVRSIYSSLRGFFDVLFVNSNKTFSKPVMVPFPFPGRTTLGFVTSEFDKFHPEGGATRYVRVFVPTSPNPSLGFTLTFKKEDVKFPALSPEEAFRMIIAGGALSRK
jgi:uncharacterized membrane protein